MLYRFQIELSDIDRGKYESLDFRIALHPSETLVYLLSRVFAYCLSYDEGVEFSAAGLADPDAPALLKLGLHNSVDLWIEIGNPPTRKLHKATKTAKQVRVFTYKNPEVLKSAIVEDKVHRGDGIEITALPSAFLENLATKLDKLNKWTLVVQQGQVDVTVDNETFVMQLN